MKIGTPCSPLQQPLNTKIPDIYLPTDFAQWNYDSVISSGKGNDGKLMSTETILKNEEETQQSQICPWFTSFRLRVSM